ncbi:hypothetical protein PMAYCL1PPCAC_15010, partial [Pristionchus mayeri]
YIDSVNGICSQWSSPSLCLLLNAIQMSGTSHYAVMIAFCSCYRYYVLAFSRCEPTKRNLLLVLVCIHIPTFIVYRNFARTPLLEGSSLTRAINESDTLFDQHLLREEMLL